MKLLLSGCDMGQTTMCRLLAGSVALLSNLSELDLSDNDIPNDEIVTLLQSMYENHTVKKLVLDRSLGGKKVDRDRGIEACSELLQSPMCGLEHLSIAHCRLKKRTIPILEALFKNTTLKTLNIAGNLMGDVGASMLACLLQHNRTLTHITWDENLTTSLGLREVAAALSCNQIVTTMPLPLVDIMKADSTETHSAAHILQSALCSNRQLATQRPKSFLPNDLRRQRAGSRRTKSSISEEAFLNIHGLSNPTDLDDLKEGDKAANEKKAEKPKQRESNATAAVLTEFDVVSKPSATLVCHTKSRARVQTTRRPPTRKTTHRPVTTRSRTDQTASAVINSRPLSTGKLAEEPGDMPVFNKPVPRATRNSQPKTARPLSGITKPAPRVITTRTSAAPLAKLEEDDTSTDTLAGAAPLAELEEDETSTDTLASTPVNTSTTAVTAADKTGSTNHSDATDTTTFTNPTKTTKSEGKGVPKPVRPLSGIGGAIKPVPPADKTQSLFPVLAEEEEDDEPATTSIAEEDEDEHNDEMGAGSPKHGAEVQETATDSAKGDEKMQQSSGTQNNANTGAKNKGDSTTKLAVDSAADSAGKVAGSDSKADDTVDAENKEESADEDELDFSSSAPEATSATGNTISQKEDTAKVGTSSSDDLPIKPTATSDTAPGIKDPEKDIPAPTRTDTPPSVPSPSQPRKFSLPGGTGNQNALASILAKGLPGKASTLPKQMRLGSDSGGKPNPHPRPTSMFGVTIPVPRSRSNSAGSSDILGAKPMAATKPVATKSIVAKEIMEQKTSSSGSSSEVPYTAARRVSDNVFKMQDSASKVELRDDASAQKDTAAAAVIKGSVSASEGPVGALDGLAKTLLENAISIRRTSNTLPASDATPTAEPSRKPDSKESSDPPSAGTEKPGQIDTSKAPAATAITATEGTKPAPPVTKPAPPSTKPVPPATNKPPKPRQLGALGIKPPTHPPPSGPPPSGKPPPPGKPRLSSKPAIPASKPRK